MKSTFAVAALAAAIAVVAAAPGAEAAKVIRIGHIRDTNHPTHAAALKFQEVLQAESKGAYEVKVYPNSQLGGPKEMFVQMQTGDLEMVYGGINTLAWIKGGEAFEITAIPFLFRDYAHMKKALEADFFKPIIAAAEKETGVKIVAINGDTAPRGLSSRDNPVNTATDFKGLKIRTAASPTVLKAMQTLGALPQQIPFADLYMALKTGVVDAQENGASVVLSSSLFEVQKYYMRTDYIRDVETFYMSLAIWNDLPAADRAMIAKAANAAGDFETQKLDEIMKDVYAKLGERMTVVVPNLESIRQALAGAFDEFEGKKWPKGLIAQIAAVK
jgi:tripartite ATP-independent transporter DctP family solute receptor